MRMNILIKLNQKIIFEQQNLEDIKKIKLNLILKYKDLLKKRLLKSLKDIQ